MSVFGDFYDKAYSFRSSKKERRMRSSEDWSSSLLAGSSENIQLEEPVRSPVFIMFLVVLVVAFAVLMARLMYLQILTGERHSLLASNNRVRTTAIAAPRGVMYDRNGVVLARNNAQFDVVVVPTQLPKDAKLRSESYQKVATITGKSFAEVQSLSESKGLRHALPILLSENVSREVSLNLEEQRSSLNGFTVESNPSREYLDGGSLAPFLGYIGRISAEEYETRPDYRPVDFIGKTGLEKAYETDLRGNYGKEQTEVDATGLAVRSLARIEPEPGNSLVLSVDKGLQDVMRSAVESSVNAAGARAGAAIAVDPRNGQVLGAVNYPSYDGNLFAKGISSADYQSLLNNTSKPLFNRVSSGEYPIGSTVKPFISVAGLEEKVISSSTTVVDRGKIEVQNEYNPSIVYTFKGYNINGLGTVNVLRAISLSSDIFYYVLGGGYKGTRGLGATKLAQWYERFGFGKSTSSDIATEADGFVPNPEKKKTYSKDSWTVGDTYNISIGQGDLRATPLQLAMATAGIANGGTLYKPHFAAAIKNQDGTLVRNIEPEVVTANLASAQSIRIVQQGMEMAVDIGGTACCSIKNTVAVKVAGKTGTAETSSEGFDGKNLRTKAHAWFTAYAPSDNPKIAIVVLIENAGEGSEFAVPASQKILQWYFSTPRE